MQFLSHYGLDLETLSEFALLDKSVGIINSNLFQEKSQFMLGLPETVFFIVLT